MESLKYIIYYLKCCGECIDVKPEDCMTYLSRLEVRLASRKAVIQVRRAGSPQASRQYRRN